LKRDSKRTRKERESQLYGGGPSIFLGKKEKGGEVNHLPSLENHMIYYLSRRRRKGGGGTANSAEVKVGVSPSPGRENHP